jgi:hypothetical protein
MQQKTQPQCKTHPHPLIPHPTPPPSPPGHDVNHVLHVLPLSPAPLGQPIKRVHKPGQVAADHQADVESEDGWRRVGDGEDGAGPVDAAGDAAEVDGGFKGQGGDLGCGKRGHVVGVEAGVSSARMHVGGVRGVACEVGGCRGWKVEGL